MALLPTVAQAATHTVDLNTARKFAILAGQGVTNVGPTVINGRLGTHPNGAVTGFPPGIVHGEVHRADAVALQAQSDLTAAYTDAAGRTGASVGPQLGGLTLTSGVYNGGALNITGKLTLDGPGVYVFTASSSLVTATGSRVSFINGADPCDVFWQVTSDATLNGPKFVGTVMALTSITVGDGVHVDGRLLARNGDVTLINDVVDASACGGDTSGPPSNSPEQPAGHFLGPCGEPFYAAVFDNRHSTVSMRFTFKFVKFSTHRVAHIARTVDGGARHTTAYHHVLGGSIMTISAGGNVVKRIRSAPGGNYPPCP
ncbi:MAG: ice-binding family protein [Actinomycetota bacterium]